MIKFTCNARCTLAVHLPNLILILSCYTIFARHNRNLRLQLKEFPNRTLGTFATRLCLLVLVLACDTVFARHKRRLTRSKIFTSDAWISLAFGHARHVRILTSAAVLARHCSRLRHLLEELTRHAWISLALGQARRVRILTSAAVFARCLVSLILILPRPARSTVWVSGLCRATISDRAAAGVAGIARTS